MSAQGDLDQLDALVRQHMQAALRFAIRLTGSVDAAEEALQDAFLRATRYWRGFRQTSSFQTWFYRIVINTVRDGFDQRKRRLEQFQSNRGNHLAENGRSHAVHEHLSSEPSPTEVLLKQELSEIVAALVTALPERQRNVVVLSLYEHCAAAEVAEILDISVANVHSTLHVARSTLQKQLAPYLQDQR